jgi:hypothetical protein
MIHRWPPNDAVGGNTHGPDPKTPSAPQRRGPAQITATRRGARISSSYHGRGAGRFALTSSKNAGAAACVQAPLHHPTPGR